MQESLQVFSSLSALFSSILGRSALCCKSFDGYSAIAGTFSKLSPPSNFCLDECLCSAPLVLVTEHCSIQSLLWHTHSSLQPCYIVV
jgi:hypothetical protein